MTRLVELLTWLDDQPGDDYGLSLSELSAALPLCPQWPADWTSRDYVFARSILNPSEVSNLHETEAQMGLLWLLFDALALAWGHPWEFCGGKPWIAAIGPTRLHLQVSEGGATVLWATVPGSREGWILSAAKHPSLCFGRAIVACWTNGAPVSPCATLLPAPIPAEA